MQLDARAGDLCPVADAELAVTSIGQGPPLLMIAGGLGAGDSYRGLARLLSEDYTVVSYDRRGHFRSTDRSTGQVSVRQQTEDALALIEHLGLGPVTVFGNSAGGLVGLDLVATHPDVVTALVAHEPPAIQVLPDGQRWLDLGTEQVKLAREGDVLGAFVRFLDSIAGTALPQNLRAIRVPNEQEWYRLFDREILGFYDWMPDIAALRRSRVDITLMAGEESRGYFHYLPAKILALELGLPFLEVPGAHFAPQRSPARFAETLREVLPPAQAS